MQRWVGVMRRLLDSAPPGWSATTPAAVAAVAERSSAALHVRTGSDPSSQACAVDAPVLAAVYDPVRDVFVSMRHNTVRQRRNAVHHAELLALSDGCEAAGNERLKGLVLVSTLEPCVMCVGAAIHARVDGIVFGAANPKAGAVQSQLLMDNALAFANHRPWWVGGVLAEECAQHLQAFFRARR